MGVAYRRDEELGMGDLQARCAELREWLAPADLVYVTVCADVLPQSVAPGVSAPSARGVSMDVIEPLLSCIADTGKVRVFDIAELAPRHALADMTSRVAARLVHHVCGRLRPAARGMGGATSVRSPRQERCAPGASLRPRAWHTRAQRLAASHQPFPVILRLLLVIALFANGWTPVLPYAHAMAATQAVAMGAEAVPPCHGEAAEATSDLPSAPPADILTSDDPGDCCGPGEACFCTCLHAPAAAMSIAARVGALPATAYHVLGDAKAASWRPTPPLRPPIV